ncbi:MAG: alpha/beta hydrolase [Acidobacteriota bacterium]|nr:alpha/beta hydrolase [Acidobacteriota bacterium]
MVSRRRRIWRVVRVVWATLGVASVAALFWGVRATGLPEGTLVSDERVEIVRAQDTISFRPRPDDPARMGLLFFPGALVEPAAYAPMARRLAEAGHRVVIVRLPFRLAPTPAYEEMVFQTARETMAASPGRWAIGGHSRGGKLATRFAAGHAGALAGLALVATTHPRELDLSSLPPSVAVMKIFGSEDGLASPEEVRQYASLLPPHTTFVEVRGGDHRQFAYYRYQLMGGRAAIGLREQQDQLIAALLTLLERS